MGKNKCGGNKQKAMENSHAQKHVQYSLHEDQIYVVVTKSLGNSTFQVSDHLGLKYIAHVRGKMKGASKRKYFIQTNDILLVEKRNQTVCDILTLFNDTHHHNIHTYPLLQQIIHSSSSHSSSSQNNLLYTNDSLYANTIYANTENIDLTQI
jgi:initiation factor 1A